MHRQEFWSMVFVVTLSFMISWLMLASVGAWAATLYWTPAAGEVDGYRIYASTDTGATWALQDTLINPAPGVDGKISREFTNPAASTIYRVSAYNAHGESYLSHIFTGYDPADMPAPPDWQEGSMIGGSE